MNGGCDISWVVLIYLQTGIEFEKVVFVAMRLVEVLHGPRPLVADGYQQSLRRSGHRLEGSGGDEVGRTLLENLLKATLLAVFGLAVLEGLGLSV